MVGTLILENLSRENIEEELQGDSQE